MLDRLRPDEVREALRLLGASPPAAHGRALRALRETIEQHGFVRDQLDRAPPKARSAFLQLVQDGPATVEALLGRGWWGRGMLPEPLDWLQRRALVTVDVEGRVHVTDAARKGYLSPAPGPSPDAGERLDRAPAGIAIEPAGSVAVCDDPILLNRALAVDSARLRLIAPSVALSPLRPRRLIASLRDAGIRVINDITVVAASAQPALPSGVEEAFGPHAIRRLLQRALDEGRQVHLSYFPSSRGGAATERVVDPWTFEDDLLTGYCHLRSAERTFAIDRIGRARLLPGLIEHPAG